MLPAMTGLSETIPQFWLKWRKPNHSKVKTGHRPNLIDARAGERERERDREREGLVILGVASKSRRYPQGAIHKPRQGRDDHELVDSINCARGSGQTLRDECKDADGN